MSSKGLVVTIFWIAAPLVVTWVLFRLNKQQFWMASLLVAAGATILSVAVPMVVRVSGDDVTHIHWDNIALFAGGAFLISLIFHRILVRRDRKFPDPKVFD